MKTASLTYLPPHLIDTAPLTARYEVMVAAIVSFMTAGRYGDVLRYSHKLRRLVRVFTRLDAQNILMRRKLAMLSDKSWRERVLNDLGGMRRLKRWEATKARLENRTGSAPKTLTPQDPAWLLTPERIARSERLKARARANGRAGAPEGVFRDRVKMDFDGLFRLAPLPRAPREARQVRVYTENTLVDYPWNNIPFATETGFGPATVWPVEFYAAMAAEANSELLSACHSGARSHPERPNVEESRLNERMPLSTFRGPRCGPEMADMRAIIPTISLEQYLSPKVQRDLLGSLTS